MYPEFISSFLTQSEYNQTILAIGETLVMVAVPGSLAILFGGILGLILFILRPDQKFYNKNKKVTNKIYYILDFLVNITRSVPFIILMIALLPLTRILLGKSIGTLAACVPLTIAAIPFLARIFESACLTVSKSVIEAAESMGASVWQIVVYIVLPEAKIAFINGTSLVLVTLVGYSAMAGALAGGGLGALAFNYGYQRFNNKIILITVVLMVLLVQCLQSLNNYICKRYNHA
jgi:D-methionine transport system permease protein